MKFKKTSIPGLEELFPRVHPDNRGKFIKTYSAHDFLVHGLRREFVEDYYTISSRNVLRGLHFQTPPHGHAKIVSCVMGSVLDAVLDLRVGSPTFGRHELFRLTADSANMLYIPEGLAHGFYVESLEAIMTYKVSSNHVADHDCGVLWSSAGIPWPTNEPVISDRDRNLPPMSDFESPFVYKECDG